MERHKIIVQSVIGPKDAKPYVRAAIESLNGVQYLTITCDSWIDSNGNSIRLPLIGTEEVNFCATLADVIPALLLTQPGFNITTNLQWTLGEEIR